MPTGPVSGEPSALQQQIDLAQIAGIGQPPVPAEPAPAPHDHQQAAAERPRMLASAGIFGLARAAALQGEATVDAAANNAAPPAPTLPPPPSAADARAAWKQGVYPEGPSLEDVAAGKAHLGINTGGPPVRGLQQMLNQLGAQPPLAVDGKFGPMTLAGLNQIQRQLGLPESGACDAASLAAIQKAIQERGLPGPSKAPAPYQTSGTGMQGGVPDGGIQGVKGGLPFVPNEQALEAARNTTLYDHIQNKTPQFAAIYKEASEKTGVPASMIAAIHFNESHQSSGAGPESGYGLDPRHIKDGRGNAILQKYGIPGPWQRGQTTPQAQLQSAVIAAETLKDNAKYLGFEIGPNMTGNQLAAVITAYGMGAGKAGPALETGKSFIFDASDPQPHVRHPGGTSIAADGSTVKVAPGIKEGLLRWDVLIPLMGEQLGETGFAGSEPPPPATAQEPGGAARPGGPGGPAGPAPTEGASGPGGASRASGQLGLPPRPAGAMTGSEFIARTQGMNRIEREAFILEQIQSGNVPDFSRQLKEVTVNANGHTLTFQTMPDYLAIGSDQDFVRIPMDPLTAQKIADQAGMSLPTPKMVDAVYQQAGQKLTPSPMTPGAQMMSSDYYIRHQRTIEGQRTAPLGTLTAGHKKDVVLTNRLADHPDRVAIYGWHQPNGKPIQPRSTIHENTYADYSHGVRLVAGTVKVDGVDRPIAEVLKDPVLSALLSDEGPLRVTRQPRV